MSAVDQDGAGSQTGVDGDGDAPIRVRRETRPARRNELRLVAAVLRGAIAEHPSYSPAHRAFEMYSMRASALEELWRQAPGNIMVGTVDGSFAAFAVVVPENGIGWMRWGVALPEFRRTGIAVIVLEAVATTFRERGFTKLCSVTRTDNRRAIALVKQKRFKLVCEMRRHWFGEDFFYWERMLDPGTPAAAAISSLPIATRVAIRVRHAALDLAGKVLRRG